MKKSSSIFMAVMVMMFAVASCNSTQGQAGGVQTLQQEDFQKVLKQENAIVVDVRTPGEVSEGIIKGATVFADIKGNNFEQEIGKLDKSKTYIVYCRSGARSQSAATYMVENGFKKVYNLSGGISNWKGETTKP